MIGRKTLHAALAASTAWIAMTGTALAQDTGTPTSEVGQGEGDDANIIVTAQRREERLIEIPQSISVVGGETLERQQATSFIDYAPLVPGLNITQENPGEARVILPGINTGSVGSTVAIYVDDVPFGSSGSLSNGGVLAGDFDTFDVARVEVLRGPQGTLYGSNALGGVLKFITAAPELGRWEARGQGGIEFVKDGDTGYFGNAVVNAPLGDNVAVRASGYYRLIPGYVDSVGLAANEVNDAQSYGGRASVLFQASDAISVRLFALAQNIRADAPSTFTADPLSLDPVDPITGAQTDGERLRYQRFPDSNDVDYRLYNGTLDWEFDFATLTSITSFGILDQESSTDSSTSATRGLVNALYAPTAPNTVGFTLTSDVRTEKFTQEVRLTSASSDRFEWLVGAYYTKETGELFQRFNPFTLSNQALLPRNLTIGGASFDELIVLTLDSDYQEIAGFANATFKFTPRFEISGGLRYSANDQTSRQVQEGAINALLGAANPDIINGESSEDVVTWSISPRFELNDRTSIYARVAKGYRPGGPNAIPPTAGPDFPREFQADTLISYEAGIRGQTPDGTFSFDASIYYLDWKDILINTIVVTPAGNFGANANGQDAESFGIEATLTARPVRGLTALANIAYNDAKLKDDTVPESGGVNTVGGLAGDQLPYAPHIRANVSVDYEWALSDAADAYIGGSVHLTDDQPAGFSAAYRTAFGRRLELDGYHTVDLRAGVDFGRFTASAYIKNLFDSYGLVNAGYPFSVPTAIGGQNRQLVTATSIRPRTIGITLGAAF